MHVLRNKVSNHRINPPQQDLRTNTVLSATKDLLLHNKIAKGNLSNDLCYNSYFFYNLYLHVSETMPNSQMFNRWRCLQSLWSNFRFQIFRWGTFKESFDKVFFWLMFNDIVCMHYKMHLHKLPLAGTAHCPASFDLQVSTTSKWNTKFWIQTLHNVNLRSGPKIEGLQTLQQYRDMAAFSNFCCQILDVVVPHWPLLHLWCR